MSDFVVRLHALVVEELASSGGSEERLTLALNGLVSALALTCAASVGGDPQRLPAVVDLAGIRLVESATRAARVAARIARAER